MKTNFLYILLYFAALLIAGTKECSAQININERLSVFNNDSETDTVRAKAIEDVSWEYSYRNLDSALFYAKIELDFVKKIKDKKWTAFAYNTLGASYFDRGDLQSSLENYLNALKIFEEQNIIHEIAGIKNNIASVYITMEDYEKAEKTFLEGIKLCNESGNNKRLAEIYINYGIMLRELSRKEEAIEYYLKAKNIEEIQSNDYMMSYIILDLAATYDLLGQDSLALAYYSEALAISEKLGDLQGIGTVYNDMGILYNKQGKYELGIQSCLKAVEITKGLNALSHEFYTCMCLSDGYIGIGDYKNGLKYYKLMEEYEDSLLNESNIEEATRLELNFSFEKEQLADSLENAKKAQIIDLQHAADLQKEANSKLVLYGGLGIATVILILLSFVIIQKQRDNKVIIKKNHEVEFQKKEIQAQKEIVDEKNKEILDSIAYAKRIQSAILPPDRVIKSYLQNSFVLYKPKDIVAGDFYWMENQGNNILFAAADCTGHGVPGAMVSVVCHNALNRSVREYHLTDPAKILDKVTELVVEQFEKSEEDVKDGMDIALCSLNLEDKKLSYSGANNPLWIIRKNNNDRINLSLETNEEELNGYTLIEIKANKQPIGKFDHTEPFKCHSIELQKEDIIYIFSDGYIDQFGGEKGKKFKSKAFKALLTSIQSESMDKQRKIINDKFENWRGEIEQIDDVCIIGVKI